MSENTGAIKAPTAGRFCDLLAKARAFKLPGWWDGSAYRHHPCGIVRRGIIFTNEWHTNDYCSARVMLDPTSPLRTPMYESCAYGDPGMYPERGGTLSVYSTGLWSEDDGPWRQAIIEILAELEQEIAVAEEAAKAASEVEMAAQRAKRLSVVEAARKAMEATR